MESRNFRQHPSLAAGLGEREGGYEPHTVLDLIRRFLVLVPRKSQLEIHRRTPESSEHTVETVQYSDSRSATRETVANGESSEKRERGRDDRNRSYRERRAPKMNSGAADPSSFDCVAVF